MQGSIGIAKLGLSRSGGVGAVLPLELKRLCISRAILFAGSVGGHLKHLCLFLSSLCPRFRVGRKAVTRP
jgi:hypothetical protein